jgi:hypothetical protein
MNRKPTWVTVAVAASLMGLGKRGALKRLVRLDRQLEGRLLRAIGTKAMPKGAQASKYLVCLPVLREAMDPDLEDHSRALAEVRAELTLMHQKLEALRKAVRPLLPKATPEKVKRTRTDANGKTLKGGG